MRVCRSGTFTASTYKEVASPLQLDSASFSLNQACPQVPAGLGLMLLNYGSVTIHADLLWFCQDWVLCCAGWYMCGQGLSAYGLECTGCRGRLHQVMQGLGSCKTDKHQAMLCTHDRVDMCCSSCQACGGGWSSTLKP